MISISTNKILTKDQINLMHGNDTYMKMLKNKITVDDFKNPTAKKEWED